MSDRVTATGRVPRAGVSPAFFGSQLLELWADAGVTLGSTPRAAGTSPPVVTWDATTAQELYIAIDSVAGGTARGQATFKWGVAGSGGAMTATGVTTAATTTLATPAGNVIVTWPTGTYNTDQSWSATVSIWADQCGLANDAAQATAANQVLYRATSFNGYPALDWGSAGTANRNLVTPSMSMSVFTWFAVTRADASSGYVLTHNADSGVNGGYMYGTTPGDRIERGGNITANTPSPWLQDAVRKTACVTFNGTHATNLMYTFGVKRPVVVSAGSDPGTATATGPLYIGTNQSGAIPFRGLMAGILVFSRALSEVEVKLLHRYAMARFPL